MPIEPDRDLGRALDSADNPLERQVLLRLYASPEQRRLRRLAWTGLIVKHGLRGFLFSWPLYLLGLAALALDGPSRWLLALLLVPALWISSAILRRGLREEGAGFVSGRVLKPGAVRVMLLGKRGAY